MKQYNRILFVAENGTCRAPMAAGILGEYVLKHPVEIGARGMIVLFPEPLNQKAEAVMISNGINLEGYMSAQLTEEDFYRGHISSCYGTRPVRKGSGKIRESQPGECICSHGTCRR